MWEKGRLVDSHIPPNRGPGQQPRHVPWLGIELVTFRFTGQHSIHWAALPRALSCFLSCFFSSHSLWPFLQLIHSCYLSKDLPLIPKVLGVSNPSPSHLPHNFRSPPLRDLPWPPNQYGFSSLSTSLSCFISLYHLTNIPYYYWFLSTVCIALVLKDYMSPWVVWLSGLSTDLQTKKSPVGVPVREHAQVSGQVPSWRHVRGNLSYTLMFLSLPPRLSKK